jgi:hypothetical protein
MKMTAAIQWGEGRPIEIRAVCNRKEEEHVPTEEDCHDDMQVAISNNAGECDRDLKKILVHSRHREFVMEARREDHLNARLAAAFRELNSLKDKRTVGLPTPLQTGLELWLIDLSSFNWGETMDGTHQWWGRGMTAFKFGKFKMLLRMQGPRRELRSRSELDFRGLIAEKLALRMSIGTQVPTSTLGGK